MIRIHLDEDVDMRQFAGALRHQGFLVTTSFEAGLNGSSDLTQMEFATAQSAVFLTANIGDFAVLHKQWLESGRSHPGIIVMPQQRFSIGDIVRRLLRLSAQNPVMTSGFFYLANY